MNKHLIYATLITVAMTMTGCHESLEKRCAREAREYTEKLCPAPVGKDIIVDSMGFDAKTRTVWYYYSLSGNLDNTDAISRSHANIRRELIKAVRNATNLKMYKDEGYNFGYVYYSGSKPGAILFQVIFHPKDYK